MILHQSSLVMLPISVTGPWYESTSLQILKEFNNLLCGGKHFLGLLIAGLVSLVIVIASAIAVTQEVHTVHYVNNLAKNVSIALGTQEVIDRKLETRFKALEETVQKSFFFFFLIQMAL